VDADSLDTENFCAPNKAKLRGTCDPFDVLVKKFNERMSLLLSSSDESRINQYRREILEMCKAKAALPPQMFTLTVPTGGGKTLSSMAFALDHLIKNDLKRIFFVIPYTSIIEQNAAIFRDIFGGRNVLEHHSNFDTKDMDSEDLDTGVESYTLATENWDVPIVVTTNVQFFESLFSNKRSRCRKLHNLVRSVIILDEAQMLPTGYLKPCLMALSELVRNYGSSVVICTATQPKLAELLDKSIRPVEMTHSPQELYEAFKRVNVYDIGELSDAELSIRLRGHRQALCIVNTRKHAKVLYDSISDLENCHHLSARMCPVHRRQRLAIIKTQLNKGLPCRVISTQLIEAGVDIDFPVVYRAMAGIDSIAQAAGRCNREGKREKGDVLIFRSREDHGKATAWQRRTAEISEMVIKDFQDPLSLLSVATYFQKLYFHEGDAGLDKKRILSLLEERHNELSFPFEDVGDTFRIIEDNTRDLIIPYDDMAISIVNDMRNTIQPWKYARMIQGYSISIYQNEFDDLVRSGSVETIHDRFYVLTDMERYSESTGLVQGKHNGIEMSLLIV
jgi:CRISPR-associated endonuclease/helicase Cas3/CRISPR-associated endonuclease Cas3-HD